MNPLSQYRLKSDISCITFKSNFKMKDSKSREKEYVTFFLAGIDGAVYYADDVGHCNELVNVSNMIEDELRVLTEDLNLSVFKFSQDGRPNLDTCYKLSGGMKKEDMVLVTEWVGLNLVISVNGSPPRIWDGENEETIVLDRPGCSN